MKIECSVEDASKKLNAFFKKDQIDINIVNASKGGKTTRGYYNDFEYWFPKIKNFNPKIFIFYTGVNDASLNIPKYYDNVKRDSHFNQIEDYIKNNSIIYAMKVKIQNKYFGKIRKHLLHQKYLSLISIAHLSCLSEINLV